MEEKRCPYSFKHNQEELGRFAQTFLSFFLNSSVSLTKFTIPKLDFFPFLKPLRSCCPLL